MCFVLFVMQAEEITVQFQAKLNYNVSWIELHQIRKNRLHLLEYRDIITQFVRMKTIQKHIFLRTGIHTKHKTCKTIWRLSTDISERIKDPLTLSKY